MKAVCHNTPFLPTEFLPYQRCNSMNEFVIFFLLQWLSFFPFAQCVEVILALFLTEEDLKEIERRENHTSALWHEESQVPVQI